VLLDEPFSGLDAALRVDTREAVMRALAEEGTTAVLVTHDQAEALSMGREVAVLREGRLVQSASPTAVYRQPVDFGVARFVGEAIFLPGDASSGRVVCALGVLDVGDPVEDGPVEVMIRPEQIRSSRDGRGNGTGEESVRARVVDHTYNGPDTVIRLALESDPKTIVKTRTFAHDIPETGELVDLKVHGPVVVYSPRNQARVPAAIDYGSARSQP
jgi:iron(III) transport system ATP-binding protein